MCVRFDVRFKLRTVQNYPILQRAFKVVLEVTILHLKGLSLI